jgi:hypothetical protein
MLTDSSPVGVHNASRQTTNDVRDTFLHNGAEAASRELAFDIAAERDIIFSTLGTGTAGEKAYSSYLRHTMKALERTHVLPELSLTFDEAGSSSSSASRFSLDPVFSLPGISTKSDPLESANVSGNQQQALNQLERLPQDATLEKGQVLYDIARDALMARNGITHESTDSDSILREVNRIMVLNGYPDAHLDGKSHITMADLPRAWNGVSYGQDFKLYDQAELTKLSELAANVTNPSGTPNGRGSEPPPEETPRPTGNPTPPALPQPGDGGGPQPDGGWPPTGGGADKGDPNSFFICQFFNPRFNPNGPSSSEDCGPTSLAMIAKYYGVSFRDVSNGQTIDAASADPEALVRGVRGLMTGKDSTKDGTTVGQVEKAAHDMGFHTSAVDGMGDLNTALDRGEMVVLSGNPKDYEKELGLHYGVGGKIYNGGHFITIVGHNGDNYIVNDPANGHGSMVLTYKQVEQYILNEQASGEVGVAVFP